METIVEVTIERVLSGPAEAADAPSPVDPLQEAAGVIDHFLRAVANRDWETLTHLCEAGWAMQPDTAALMDHTFSSARPVSWAFTETYVPDWWTPEYELPWLIAEMVVTFDLEEGSYETIPAGLRAVFTDAGWQVDPLAWGGAESGMEPAVAFPANEAVALPDEVIAHPANEVIVCPRCGQRLSVPSDKGRLRVTCSSCGNLQWYPP